MKPRKLLGPAGAGALDFLLILLAFIAVWYFLSLIFGTSTR